MRLYNTLSRQLEELPAPPGPIRMYFCGPTVYQRAHIGNARPFVLGMWLRTWLRHRGYEATLVHNITDVNDKIYEAAPNESAALAERATAWYIEDTCDLGLGMPDAMPKATESIPSIVHFIEELIERDFAYAVEGDVYFSVARDPQYGRLSGQRPEQVEEQEPNPLKKDPRDFALWKANKPGEDTSWDSPWGRGRPGWHLECSAMADDDFNTPEALALLHGWRDHELLRRGLELFGLGSLAESEEAPADVVKLAEARQAARAAGDFAEADRSRDEIEKLGWEVRDKPGGFDLYRI